MNHRSTDPYEELSYDSLCLPRTHPDHLAALGMIMGLAVPSPERCRVLELGCASGGNLIPMAYRLPAAAFVGVDLSGAQIAAGNGVVAALQLNNIELRAADIADLKPNALGQFDYIIAHGVYSWVPKEVRARILPLVRSCLTPSGIGYVSFNTLPGWRMRGMLRDVLRDAARAATGTRARIEAARSAIARLESGLSGLDGAAAAHLRAEIKNLCELPDSYLVYEYLAEHNSAILFRDFLARCELAGLRYLSDAEPSRNFPSSYGDGVERALADLEDGADVEQWLDFLANRNFREAVLIRDDAECDEQVDLSRLARLSFSADLLPLKRIEDRAVRAGKRRARFVQPDGAEEVAVTHPLAAYLVDEMARRYPDAVPLAAILPDAMARFNPSDDRLEGANAGAFEAALQELFALFARGYLRAATEPRLFGSPISDRPRACPLATAQAASGSGRVATIQHGNLGIDGAARVLLTLLDGHRDFAALVDALLDSHSAIAGPAWSREQAEQQVRRLVGLFRRYGVLAVDVDRARDT